MASSALLACVEGATFTARSNLPALEDSGEREARGRVLRALASRARELAQTVHDRVAQ
jgi:hypothetical protein